jgi:hypothetical protein
MSIGEREVNARDMGAMTKDVVAELMGATEPLAPGGTVRGEDDLRGPIVHVHPLHAGDVGEPDLDANLLGDVKRTEGQIDRPMRLCPELQRGPVSLSSHDDTAVHHRDPLRREAISRSSDRGPAEKPSSRAANRVCGRALRVFVRAKKPVRFDAIKLARRASFGQTERRRFDLGNGGAMHFQEPSHRL